MLKDIADSKRMNSNIKALPTVVTSPVRGRRQDAASISPLTSTVTSALFWPPHHQDTLKLPSQVQNVLLHHGGLSGTMPHTHLACCCKLAIWLYGKEAVLGVVLCICSDLTVISHQIWQPEWSDSWHSVQVVHNNTWPHSYGRASLCVVYSVSSMMSTPHGCCLYCGFQMAAAVYRFKQC